jgi:hypothetical protein
MVLRAPVAALQTGAEEAYGEAERESLPFLRTSSLTGSPGPLAVFGKAQLLIRLLSPHS